MTRRCCCCAKNLLRKSGENARLQEEEAGQKAGVASRLSEDLNKNKRTANRLAKRGEPEANHV